MYPTHLYPEPQPARPQPARPMNSAFPLSPPPPQQQQQHDPAAYASYLYQQYYHQQQPFPAQPPPSSSVYSPHPQLASAAAPVWSASDADSLMTHLASAVDDGTKESQQSLADMMFLAGLQQPQLQPPPFQPQQPPVLATHAFPHKQPQRGGYTPRAAAVPASAPPPSSSSPPLPPSAAASLPSSPISPLSARLSSVLPRHFGFSSPLHFQLRAVEALLLDRRDVLLVSRRHTGRSSCYQLAALLSQKLSVVLCPTSRPAAAALTRELTGSIEPEDSSAQQQWQLGWMQDQVLSLRHRGISAVALSFSSCDDQTMADLRASPASVSVLYLSIFSAERYVDDLSYLLSIDAVCALCVEESQCASDASPDCRQEYSRIAAIREALVERSAVLRSKRVQEEGGGSAGVGRLPLLALCSPCCSQTQLDVMRIFRFPASRHLHLPAHSDCGLLMQRPNVCLSVRQKQSLADDMLRLFQLHPDVERRKQRERAEREKDRQRQRGGAAEAARDDDGISGAADGERRFHDLPSLRGCGLTVLYCGSKKLCHELQDFLLHSLHIRSAVLHAGLTDEQRVAAVRTAHFHQVEVIITNCSSVATFAIQAPAAAASTSAASAASSSSPPPPPAPSHDNSPAVFSAFFVNKPDCRRVIFYGLPLSLESFIQLSADAGRDGGPAAVSLYYSPDEYSTARALLSSLSSGDACRLHLWRLDNVKAYAETTLCRKLILQRYFDWHDSGGSSSVIAGADGSPVPEWKPGQQPQWTVSTEPYASTASASTQCGQCDNCLRTLPALRCHSPAAADDAPLPSPSPSSLDVGDAAYLLLSAVHQTGCRFPIDVPIAVLRGEHVEAVLLHSFQRLTVFSLGASLAFRYWLSLSDILTRKGFLALSREEEVTLTNKGLAFLKSPPTASLQQSEQQEAEQRGRGGGGGGGGLLFSHLLSELPSSSLWRPSWPTAALPVPSRSRLYGRPLIVDSEHNTGRLLWLQLMSCQLTAMGGDSNSSLCLSSLLPCELSADDRSLYASLCQLLYHAAYVNGHNPSQLLQNHQLAIVARFRPGSRDGLMLAARAAGVSQHVVDVFGSRLLEVIAQHAALRRSDGPGRAAEPQQTGGAPLQVPPRSAVVPDLAFADVFIGATRSHVPGLGSSRPVRAMNHIQMMVWQQFESGDTVRSISDQRALKPHVVLAYIIYCLESYSPATNHPVFLHWPRFNIPQELMERIGQAMERASGVFGRLDVIRGQLDDDVLEEDVRIAMMRWKMERAVGRAYQSYDVYRVMTAEEARDRLARQKTEDETGEQAGMQQLEAAGEEEQKAAGGAAGRGKREQQPQRRASNGSAEHKESEDAMETEGRTEDSGNWKNGKESTQPAPPAGSAAAAASRSAGALSTPSVGTAYSGLLGKSAAALPVGPPALTSGELLHHLTLNGGESARCLQHYFQCDWQHIEPLLSKLIAEQLLWKRGPLYCPT